MDVGIEVFKAHHHVLAATFCKCRLLDIEDLSPMTRNCDTSERLNSLGMSRVVLRWDMLGSLSPQLRPECHVNGIGFLAQKCSFAVDLLDFGRYLVISVPATLEASTCFWKTKVVVLQEKSIQ